MSSPLDPNEVEALMQAIQEGQVSPAPSESAAAPVVPYDLTSQDRIIRGQMPTLDSINERIASLFGRSLAGKTRIDLRVTSGPATLLKFADVQALLSPPATVGVIGLGGGHGLAVMILEGELAQSLLAGALGDRKARPAPLPAEGRAELTSVERLVLRHLLALLCEAMASAWSDVLSFRPEVLRFESDPRMAMIAPASDVAILCPFEVGGAIAGRFELVLPYAAVEPAKKLLTSPPRLGGGGDGDARFSAALAHELESVQVELRVELGRRTLTFAELLGLEVGNVLLLNSSESAPLPILVEGRPKMTGQPRVVGGNLAVAIEQPVGGGVPRSRPPGHAPSGPGYPVAA